MRTELAHLAAALTAASGGTAPTPVELAELLWLAGRLEEADGHSDPEAEPPPQSPPPDPATGTTPTPHPRQPTPRTPPKAPAPSHRTPRIRDRVPLYMDQSEDPAAATPASLLAPAPPMLRHPLPLQRALRPLKRSVPSLTGGRVLDERATADRIARLGAHPSSWVPVLRPAPERWLRLILLHDTGPTMPVWRPLVRELHAALAQSGIFRTVTVHRATPDGRVDHLAVPHDGRTVALLLSDCTGPQWRQSEAGLRWLRTLHTLASRMPLAVIQPLPEHLWRTTALPARPGRLTAPHAAAPLSSLGFTPYDGGEPGPPRHPDAFPLPVLEPAPAWLANWSRLTATAGGVHVPGAAAWLSPSPVTDEPREDVASLTPEDLVLRFRATASPQAFRLAGHLAVGVPHLPVMRLVHAALEPEPRPQHLAEVILSGMLATTEGPPGSYVFRDGVRDLLLRSLPRTARGRTSELLARVGALIDERAGVAAGEFRAATRGADGEAFATVSEESVRRLSGGTPSPGLGSRYRMLRRLRPGGTVWEARDGELDRVVAVKLYGLMPARQRRAFLDASRVLSRIDHPNVVKVHDFGVEENGTAFTVMEFLEGVALNTLTSAGGYRLPESLRTSVTKQLARAVEAVHAAGVTHGAIGMPKVALLPDGTVKLTLFAPGNKSGPDGIAEDLHQLGVLLDLLNIGATADGALMPLHALAAEGLMSGDAARQREALEVLLRNLPPADLEPAPAERRHYLLLGPLTVTRNGAPLTPSAPALQSMLGMLLLRHGNPVSRGELTEGLWAAGKRPDRPDALLGTYASRLRNALGPGALATLPDGYALHTSTDTLDILQCQELVTLAETERAAGNLHTARNHVAAALSLWRGTPLDGVRGPAAHTARTRLTQLHLTLHRTRAELDLDLGDVDRAATDLAGLVRDHPSREDFRRLQMIALRQLGRIGEALEAYEEYEAVGGRIGPALAELHRKLLEARGAGASRSTAHASVTFEVAGDSDVGLAPIIAQLTEQAGLTARDHGLRSVPAGYEVLVKTEQATQRLLESTVTQLPAALSDLPARVRVAGLPAGVHVTVVFWPAGPDHRATRETIHAELAAHSAASSVTVSPDLVDPYTVSALGLRAMGGDPPAYWYRMLTAMSLDRMHRLATALNGLDLLQDPANRVEFAAALSGHLHQPIALRVTSLRQDTVTMAGAALSVPTGELALVKTVRAFAGADAADAFARLLVGDSTAVTEAERLPRLLDTEPPPTPRTLSFTEALDVAESEDVHALDLTLGMQTRRAPSLADTLATAEAFLLGFDGPLLQLYAGARAARDAARELTALAAELRDPEEALAGDPLGAVASPMEVYIHPLDVLRTFARHRRLAQPLRERLDAIELRALRTARPTRDADLLIRTLNSTGRPVSVVSDVSPHVVSAHLQNRALAVRAGVHGRSDDPRLLMPNPDALHRALHQPGSPTPHGVLIGSSPAELTAARTIGLPFIGYAPNRRTATRLTDAGTRHVVHNLTDLLDAIHR
ncbi:SAV_2336 N-terminal domain-related protein [Streptomyces sp. NPDC051956]|uniref:SAV_2336 N-terminal domain-related protein n=1 Tax=Streptomyces sp. NPDC051956 TaxID=3365677 RepID=UPI0037D80441